MSPSSQARGASDSPSLVVNNAVVLVPGSSHNSGPVEEMHSG